MDLNNDDVFDVAFDTDKKNALRLAKNSKVTFSGTITFVINLFGYYLGSPYKIRLMIL